MARVVEAAQLYQLVNDDVDTHPLRHQDQPTTQTDVAGARLQPALLLDTQPWQLNSHPLTCNSALIPDPEHHGFAPRAALRNNDTCAGGGQNRTRR